MFKITAILSLMLIGSTLWAASLSCDSCGSECASACGTRHFRSCCFNYLRKKRGPDNLKFYQNMHEWTPESVHKAKLPFIEDPMDPWNVLQNEFKNYPYDDTIEKLQAMYEA